jgi:hypothetical protein
MMTVMNEYLDGAPQGTNTHMDPAYQRYHGVSARDLKTFVAKAAVYGKEVPKGDANYLDHSRIKTESLCTVRVFRQKFRLKDAIGSHACSLEANTRVTNGIPLGSSLFLPVCTVNCTQTLKGRSKMTFLLKIFVWRTPLKSTHGLRLGARLTMASAVLGLASFGCDLCAVCGF